MSLPTTIKAIAAPQHGDVDVLDVVDLPFLKQEPNEVLVKVVYAGVNFIDTYQRKGLYPAKSFPVRLGQEASGVVVALPTDEKSLNDPEFKKRGFSVGINVAALYQGSLAEYISVPWHQVHPLSPSIDLLSASAALLQGLTALTFMCEAHNVQKGETILIHTVAGGLGLILAQIAHARGAIVIGTTSSQEKAELAKKHGVDHVVLYTREDTVRRVLELTNGEGVNAVFDGVGKDTFEGNFKILKRKGTFVSYGNASGPVPPFAPLKLTEKNLKFLRPTAINYLVTPEESHFYTTELFKLVENGTVKINVHKMYPFTAEGARQSHIDITGKGTSGKLVVRVSE
ncbi:NAD(P)-binding protein [Schizopora paradoxa]|uniref:Probable quinone oxidoreductase n=1 Tax=Schizopora paradoxa TaxID=27342 RepID=A0A0H2RWT2_9AGAM|nr:NAD(P)-binding protein [Schizopora paradoxa]